MSVPAKDEQPSWLAACAEIDRDAPIKVFRQIANILGASIKAGELAAGMQVPSESELCRRFGVVRETARRALRELHEEGVIVFSRGRRYYVASADGEVNPVLLGMPRYRKIASAVAQAIRSGRFPIGKPIPSEKEMVAEYAASKGTVRRAIEYLRQEGWVFTIAQLGSFPESEDKWPDWDV
ncbi:GntR family transcriptional regulator [Acrocarpospora sp. B8E8]|uniref:GntR family transcriptional regulator n=1 Tax=Acrocarpospora sp. B8E8 TaxID=3153572 RepID=UPI00325C412C